MLIGAMAAALAACNKGMPQTVSKTPPIDMERLNGDVAKIAERVKPGVLGVGLMNLESGQNWSFNGERPFPMQSVFKMPLAAAVLAEVDARRLSLEERFTLTDQMLSPPYSPIAEAWPLRADYTALELLRAAVETSDNTAADVLMKRIGGPGAVSAWLEAKDIQEIRVDRYERELQTDIAGMASFRADWRGPAFAQVRATLPAETRRAAMLRYLTDPRDTATPRGMLDFLDKLDDGQLLSQASLRRLLQMMTDGVRAPGRLKAATPSGGRLAHKPGTAGSDLGMNPASNDVGIMTLADGRKYAIVAFLSGSALDGPARDDAIADVGRAIVKAVG